MQQEHAQRLTIVKLDPVGRAVARYSGLRVPASPGWIAVIAEWTSGPVASGPLQFESGDRLFEYFSVVEPLNAFALYTADGRFKGWYANVSCPALFIEGELWWRDLYIDVIADAAGNVTVLDEEELESSGLQERDPEGYACIIAARDRLLAALATRTYPFDCHPSPEAFSDGAE